ncbi:DUF1127 domain-containing protein [Halocynthiibacter namhaensis]|uniref:DUF1127 domain-containing protein n=1 Tax=Halocynthiibacter namhaensis TaxID=1290553 RepID=UPI000579032F|nr:DUF1127 domain-containing protein [Halocynthiibacter namhaensis]
MAHVITSARPTTSFFANALRATGSFLMAITEGASRMRTVRTLENKSDQELADIGIRREDIARAVFVGRYYI